MAIAKFLILQHKAIVQVSLHERVKYVLEIIHKKFGLPNSAANKLENLVVRTIKRRKKRLCKAEKKQIDAYERPKRVHHCTQNAKLDLQLTPPLAYRYEEFLS